MKKSIIAAIAALMCVSQLAGCGNNNTPSSVSSVESGEVSYPIETDVTIKYWVRLTPGNERNEFRRNAVCQKAYGEYGNKN